MCKWHASTWNPEKYEVVGALVRFQNLMSHPSTCTRNLISVHDHPRLHRTGAHSWGRIPDRALAVQVPDNNPPLGRLATLRRTASGR
jgi:hypothetical protein